MSRALSILSVAYPFANVSPSAVGGAEQVLWSLDRGLVRRGHRSVVLAREGSSVHGTLVSPDAPGLPADGSVTVDDHAWALAHGSWRAAIARLLAEHRFDVVHFHGVDFHAYAPESGTPALATLHLPPDRYAPSVFAAARPGLHLCCVSEAQRAACPPSRATPWVVPNGIDLSAFVPRRQKRGYAVALGRVCPEKGYHLAMDAAERARVPLLLAGEVQPYEEHRRYVRERIEPRLGRGCWFIGAVGPRRRRRLLSHARCVVVSSIVEETSCLVAMEALASGTPVVAFDRGALREIVDDGRTGFLVRDVPQMADAIANADSIDPVACRRAAEERLSMRRMHEGYLALYEELRNGREHMAEAR